MFSPPVAGDIMVEALRLFDSGTDSPIDPSQDGTAAAVQGWSAEDLQNGEDSYVSVSERGTSYSNNCKSHCESPEIFS